MSRTMLFLLLLGCLGGTVANGADTDTARYAWENRVAGIRAMLGRAAPFAESNPNGVARFAFEGMRLATQLHNVHEVLQVRLAICDGGSTYEAEFWVVPEWPSAAGQFTSAEALEFLELADEQLEFQIACVSRAYVTPDPGLEMSCLTMVEHELTLRTPEHFLGLDPSPSDQDIGDKSRCKRFCDDKKADFDAGKCYPSNCVPGTSGCNCPEGRTGERLFCGLSRAGGLVQLCKAEIRFKCGPLGLLDCKLDYGTDAPDQTMDAGLPSVGANSNMDGTP